MSKIISLHSYRGGTGKSNLTANLAAQLAIMGHRVGVIDTDIQSPGIHLLFQLKENELRLTLNDYLWGTCSIAQAAYDATARLGVPVTGKVFLVPASIKATDTARILREGYDIARLRDGYDALIRDLQLDILLIDTHPGLNEETLLTIVKANMVLLMLRPDQQDYKGTTVTVNVARQLGVHRLLLLVNQVPPTCDLVELRSMISYTYQYEIGAILPYADEMMALGSAGIFSLHYPNSAVSLGLQQMAKRVIEP